jgi:hypothetical protein
MASGGILRVRGDVPLVLGVQLEFYESAPRAKLAEYCSNLDEESD